MGTEESIVKYYHSLGMKMIEDMKLIDNCKTQGNQMFQSKDYKLALKEYFKALDK